MSNNKLGRGRRRKIAARLSKKRRQRKENGYVKEPKGGFRYPGSKE